jgi:RNA polymerase sigma factor (sigma-70 family)
VYGPEHPGAEEDHDPERDPHDLDGDGDAEQNVDGGRVHAVDSTAVDVAFGHESLVRACEAELYSSAPPDRSFFITVMIRRHMTDDVEALRGAILATVRKVSPPRLRPLVEDITQDVLIRVVEIRRREWGDRPVPASYLYRAAYNAVLDELRRRRHAMEESGHGEDVFGTLSDSAAGPERHAASGEVAAAIRDCLRRLVASRRRALTLYLEESSVAEVAGALGYTAKKASHLIYRGLVDLRSCLAEKGVKP